MDNIKISAKNLGYTALADFCPRCYWLRLRTSHKLPFQSFPGIFASIDSYTKHMAHFIIDSHKNDPDKNPLPPWMLGIGQITGYEKIPHFSRNLYEDKKSGITLSGIPDDIWNDAEGHRIIVDFKTQRHTDNQDKLLPLYLVQANVYSVLFNTTENDGMHLIYMEPCTEPSRCPENVLDEGFRLCFSGLTVPVKWDRGLIRNALTKTREIFDLDKPPDSVANCKECSALEKLIDLLK